MHTAGTHTGEGLEALPCHRHAPRSGPTAPASAGFENGRAIEHWAEQGMFPMLAQFGVLLSMGGWRSVSDLSAGPPAIRRRGTVR